MKTILKFINIILIIILVILLLGLITSEVYEDVIIIAPIFFKELFILCMYILTVLFLTSGLRNSEGEYKGIWIEFISLSVVCFFLSYYSHPKVQEDILFEKIVEYNYNEDDYNELKEIHRQNNSLDYFYLQSKEVDMFRTIYNVQYDYLRERNNYKNPYLDSQFIFFGILGILLFVNGCNDFVKNNGS